MSIKKIIIITFIIIAVSSLLIYKYIKDINKNIKITNIKKFHFSYSVGYYINASVNYDINYEDGKYIATIKKDGVSEEDAKKVSINDKDVKQIEYILNKYKVNKWNGFHKVDKNVLDGNSFSLSLTLMNNDYISAYGYMVYPKNYREVKIELDTLFNNIYEGE